MERQQVEVRDPSVITGQGHWLRATVLNKEPDGRMLVLILKTGMRYFVSPYDFQLNRAREVVGE